jgi:hypothetical protein
MSNAKFSYSIAGVSWIDAKTELPEVDQISYTYLKTSRERLTANSGYRFCNFMDIYIVVAPNNRIIDSGFSNESRIYRGPSYKGIASHSFDTKQSKVDGGAAITFRQIAGARTVSPETIGAVAGAFIGGVPGYFIGQTAAHQITGFPPIWSILEITIDYSGYPQSKMISHSIFPSLTYYTEERVCAVSDEKYSRADYYDATKEIELSKWKDVGWGPLSSSNKASGGNPWGITKGIRGADEAWPN